MKGYGDLSGLDFSKGGIPETGKVNKNRSAMLIINRNSYDLQEVTDSICELLSDLLEDKIDSITIDVLGRTWNK